MVHGKLEQSRKHSFAHKLPISTNLVCTFKNVQKCSQLTWWNWKKLKQIEKFWKWQIRNDLPMVRFGFLMDKKCLKWSGFYIKFHNFEFSMIILLLKIISTWFVVVHFALKQNLSKDLNNWRFHTPTKLENL
jgi:hypothetical protein